MTNYVDRSLLLSGSVDEIIQNPGAIAGNPANSLPPGDSVEPGSLFVKCPKATFSKGCAFEIFSDTIPTPLKIYVTKVNAADSYVVFQTNESDGSAPVPAVLAPYVLADNPKITVCGYKNQLDCGMGFCSIDEALGFDGSTSYLGVDRDVSPILSGDEYDLTESTGATIVKDLMSVFYRRAEQCSAQNLEVLVCYSLFSVLAKELELSKQRSNGDKNARIGFRTITFCTPEGEVKVTAVPKMPCNKAYFINWSDFVWMGDASPMDPTQPGGSQSSWYRDRGCSYVYYKDIYFRGKLVNKKPCNSAIVRLDPVKYLDCV